jgi:hypothetical protein
LIAGKRKFIAEFGQYCGGSKKNVKRFQPLDQPRPGAAGNWPQLRTLSSRRGYERETQMALRRFMVVLAIAVALFPICGDGMKT